MEMINGCLVFAPPQTPGPISVGPAETNSAYVALLGMFPPGEPGPPPHKHPQTDEAFYLMEGEATFLLGDRELPVVPGTMVFVPRGTPHTVWNSGERPVRGMIVISPGDAEHSFVPV
jgi:mannose-6-phosphate isomerase-like protein (cupin superfamily)